MARGGWPPNSLAEWVVGQNFRGLTSAPSEGPRPVLRVELSEDEASGGETLSITYPRRRRRDAAAQSTAPAARKVRFHGDRKPLKSALKKSTNPNESSDTLVDTSDDDAEATTDDEYSDFYDSDTSDEDVPIRRRRSTFKKPKGTLCKKETDSDSSAAKDALPHPTCQCVECVKGRKILKAVIKFEAKNGVMGKQSKSTRRRRSQGFDDDTDASDSSANSTDEEASSKNGKNKRQKQKRQQNPSPRRNGQETTKAVNKNAWRMPTYPKEMQPNMIMPPHTKVTQVEHTVETDNDPRPNAFFDSTKGITRVYHGPRYGNHMGELYGKKNTDSLMPPGSAFPPGWQPHNAPWYLPGPPNGPPGSHYAQNMPAMNGQMPFTEAGWIDAASKGIGLSGMPAVLTPPMMREEMRRRESQKAASQKPGSGEAAKSTTWGAAAGANTGWPHLEEGGRGAGNGGNSKAPSPTAANSNNPADAPKADNFGGVGGWGMGDASGSKKDGVSSPFNFDHAANTGEKFERSKSFHSSLLCRGQGLLTFFQTAIRPGARRVEMVRVVLVLFFLILCRLSIFPLWLWLPFQGPHSGQPDAQTDSLLVFFFILSTNLIRKFC